MKKTLTTIRCVPRFGYEHTDVRTVDVELPEEFGHDVLLAAMRRWFVSRGIEEAVYDVDTDPSGYFVIVNDEAYHEPWGASLL